MCYIEEGR